MLYDIIAKPFSLTDLLLLKRHSVVGKGYGDIKTFQTLQISWQSFRRLFFFQVK